MSRRWPVQDAKARFSELLETACAEGPQIVTKRVWEPPCFSRSSMAEAGTDDQADLKDLLLDSDSRTENLTPPVPACALIYSPTARGRRSAYGRNEREFH